MIQSLNCKVQMHKNEQIQGVCQSVGCQMPDKLVCNKCMESHLINNFCQIQDIKDQQDLNEIIKDYVSSVNTRYENSITYCQTQKLIKIKELQKYIQQWQDGYKKFDYVEHIIQDIKLDQSALKLKTYLNDNNSQYTLNQYLNNSTVQFTKLEKYMRGQPNFMIDQEVKLQQSDLIYSIQDQLNKLNDQIRQNLKMNNDEILQFIKNYKDSQNNYEYSQYQLGIINNVQIDELIKDDEKNLSELKLEFLKYSMKQDNQKIGMLDELLEFYNQIIKKFPKNEQALENIAKIYVQKRQYSCAIQYYDKCTQINPFEFRFYHNKAYILSNHLNNLNDALNCYEQYTEIDNTNYYAHIEKAQIHKKQNNYQTALCCYFEYIKIDPNFHKKQFFYKAYQNCCTQSMEYNKIDHEVTYLQIVQLFYQQQEYKIALQLYIEYLSHNKNYYENIDTIMDILECCNKCINSDKTYLIAYMTKSNMYSQLKFFQSAIDCYDEYKKTNNNNLLQNDDYDLFIVQCCDQFIDSDQRNPAPYIKKAQILQQRNDFLAAIKCFDQYRNIDVNYYKNNEFFEAFIQCCDQYIDNEQKNHLPYYKKAQISEDKQDYKSALSTYELFIQLNTAQYLQNDSLYTNVVKCCDWYIINNNNDNVPYFKKGQILRQKGYLKEAQNCFDLYMKKSNNPNDSNIYEAILIKGLMFKQVKQYKDAILCFEKCIEMDPTKNEAKFLKKETEDLFQREQCVIQ